MKDLLKQTLAFTPLIESGTLDGHLFLDVTRSARLFGPSVDVAFKLKKAFKKTVGLDPIWSVATNKLVAKVATRVVKPAGEYIVAPGDEAAFLSPLPIHLIPGLEPTEVTRLNEFNLFFVSQARSLTLEQLAVPFHHRAPLIYDRIRGIDPAGVAPFCETCALVRADHEFADDTNDAGHLKKALYLMAEAVCKTLRNQNLASGAATMTLSYSDGLQTTSTSRRMPATSNEMVLFKNCLPVLEKAWTRRVRIRHMGLVCEKRCQRAVQTELFAQKTKETRQAGLIQAMDKIRTRFGRQAIQPALTLAGQSRQA